MQDAAKKPSLSSRGEMAMKAWHEDDAFWQTLAPYLFSEDRLTDAAGEIDGVLRLVDIAPRSAVLDLCCGIGRHSLELARRGFRVTAVDRYGPYLDRARARTEKDGLKIEFVQKDMRRFQRAAHFHLAVNLYTSFGYFEDPQDDVKVAQNLFASLIPGGKLVMELMGREVLARIFRERDWQPTEDGGFFLEERRPSADWTWLNSRWILIKNGKLKEFNITHRIYGGADLSRVLLESGFRKVELFGDLQGSPYDHAAKRLVVVATK
jgi:SAM-dependent methyltransferase